MFKFIQNLRVLSVGLVIITATIAADIPISSANAPGLKLTLEIDPDKLVSQADIDKLAKLLNHFNAAYTLEHPFDEELTQKLGKSITQSINAFATEFATSLQDAESSRKFRILSLDGGGIRGFLTCLFLSHLTHITGKPVHELFDMIIATSTGTLIATGLAIEKPEDHKLDLPNPELMLHTESIPSPYYTPEELAALYLVDGSKIFSGGAWFGGWTGPQYPDRNLNETLHKFFGEKTLRDLKLPVFLTAYDLNRRKIITYSPLNITDNENKNDFLSKILRGCVAAPTTFAPVKIFDKIVCDGGTLLNNPAALGLAKAARKFKATPEHVILFSSGCGHYTDPKDLLTYQRLGTKDWVPELLGTMFDGQVTHEIISKLHNAVSEPHLYLRISPELKAENMKTDLTTYDNFIALRDAAKKEIVRRKKDFDRLADVLIQNAPSIPEANIDQDFLVQLQELKSIDSGENKSASNVGNVEADNIQQ